MGKKRFNYAFAIVKVFVVTLVAMSMMFAVAQAQNEEDGLGYELSPEIQDIIKKGYITIGLVSKDQPPFFYTNAAGNFSGYDVDLAKGIADKLGVEIRYNRESKNFNDLIPLVSTGKADIIISKLSRTSSRALSVLFTNPYITFNQALMVNRVAVARVAATDPEIARFVKNFRGKVGVIENSSYVSYAEANFPNAQVVEFGSWEEVVDAVFSGKVLAAYRDELEIKKVIKSRPNASLLVKTILLSDTRDNISMALSWKSRHLLEWLNLYLDQVLLKKNAEELLLSYKDIFELDK